MSKTELQGAVELVVDMAKAAGMVNEHFSTVRPATDALGIVMPNRVAVRLSDNARITKAQLIANARRIRAALIDAGLSLSKGKIDYSYHMGAKADCFYSFVVGA